MWIYSDWASGLRGVFGVAVPAQEPKERCWICSWVPAATVTTGGSRVPCGGTLLIESLVLGEALLETKGNPQLLCHPLSSKTGFGICSQHCPECPVRIASGIHQDFTCRNTEKSGVMNLWPKQLRNKWILGQWIFVLCSSALCIGKWVLFIFQLERVRIVPPGAELEVTEIPHWLQGSFIYIYLFILPGNHPLLSENLWVPASIPSHPAQNESRTQQRSPPLAQAQMSSQMCKKQRFLLELCLHSPGYRIIQKKRHHVPFFLAKKATQSTNKWAF